MRVGAIDLETQDLDGKIESMYFLRDLLTFQIEYFPRPIFFDESPRVARPRTTHFSKLRWLPVRN